MRWGGKGGTIELSKGRVTSNTRNGTVDGEGVSQKKVVVGSGK